MRIAQIAPLIERVPPKKYGGTERVVHALTEELVRRGHEVTLFATGDSITSAKLVSVYPCSLRETGFSNLYTRNSWSLLNIGVAYAHQGKFDIIHDHTGPIGLPTANICRMPVLMTLHGAFSPYNKHMYKVLRRPYLVTISKAQAKPLPRLNYIGNVYNGLEMRHYPFSEKHGGYLLFVGRIAKDKGLHIAIDVARKMDLSLVIAAKLESINERYFKKYVKPFLSNKIVWIGEVDEKERNQLMSKAICFLHPAMWREPFGLTLIEAMACGCPVVAFNRGSIPEIVRPGVSGFVANNVNEMTQYVSHIDTLSRKACRDYALSHFNAQKMAENYELLYHEVLKRESLRGFIHYFTHSLLPGKKFVVSNGHKNGNTIKHSIDVV